MSKELLQVMFKSIAEGNVSKATTALSQYLNATGKHIHSLNEAMKNDYRVKIKDQHRQDYPDHLHGRLLAKTQPYRNPGEGGAYMQVSPENVPEDLKHHVEVPMHHIERVRENVDESTWHQDQATKRNGPIKLDKKKWHVVMNPPNDMKTVASHDTEEGANTYMNNIKEKHPHLHRHSHIVPPERDYENE